MRTRTRRLTQIVLLVASLLAAVSAHAQTSWKGTTSTAWNNAANWTAGVPTASVDAIIGDANFTGASQPIITANSSCKSLTLGISTKASTLSVGKALTVSGNITIGTNGTVSVTGNSTAISLTGNWSNSGTFSGAKAGQTVKFSGITQTIGGSSVTPFRKLTISAGSTTKLLVNTTVANQMTVSGVFDPNESPTFLVSGVGPLAVSAGGKILVKGSTFISNYGLSATITLNAGSTVEYGAASASQTINNTLTYATLLISGTGTRTLAGNLPALNSTAATAGNINVLAGTLDLATFTAARGTTTAGGTFSVASGATLKIGGTNTFPANYTTRSPSSASTVEYYGTNQTVSAQSYGNLTLSSSGAATKTMPVAAMTLAGNLSSRTNAGGASVSFTAVAAITVNGSVDLGSGTTFNGGSYSHSVGANWTNNGTFTGATSTVTMNGVNGVLTGTGATTFNNLTFSHSGITMTANTSVTVAGNFATTGVGTFTHTTGGSGTVTLSGASKAISGTGINFNHLTVSGSVSSAASFGIAGNLVTSGSFSASAGTITLSGAGRTISGAGAMAINALNVTGSVSTTNSFSLASDLSVSGSMSATAGTVTFNGTSSLSGTANLFNVTLNGTKLTLGSGSVLGVAGTFVLSAGTFDVTTSIPNTLTYNAAGAQTALATIYDNLTFSGSGTKTNIAALTINRDLTIDSGVTFSAGPFTNALARHWVNNGTFTPGAGTVQLAGSLDASVSGATTFNALTLNKSSSANVVTVNTNITVGTLNMTQGVMDTGTKAVTITSTRTGGGIIFGTIIRTHTFTTGVAYAFEGTNNTVTFASASGVSSITMTVKPGAVSDFPFGSSINREYAANVTASGAYNATLRLHYQDSELNGNVESNMQLWRDASGWSNSGKTANDSVNNWVEQSGRTNLVARWTLAEAADVVAWNGSVSTAWETAANWTAVQGAPSLPPASNDVVGLGVGAFTFQPTISSPAQANQIFFGSTQAIALTINASGSLTVLGNVVGAWGQNATHTINVGSQTLTVGGSLNLSDGTNGHAIHLNIGSGSVALSGSLTESGGANITFSGAGTLGIGGDFNYVSGTFTPGSGKLTYNGSAAQIVAGVTYYRLNIDKPAGTATLLSQATVNSDLIVTNAGSLQVSVPLVVAGNVTIESNATFIASFPTTTISVGGDWTRRGTFIPGLTTVLFNGSGGQTISEGTFNHLTINKASGTATLSGNVTLNADLNLGAGTLDLTGFAIARSVVGGVFTMGAGVTLKVGGGFPANFDTRNLSASSTVEYNGASAQNVSGETYGSLIFSSGGANAKTLVSASFVAGDLTIQTNATFAASSYLVELTGNWTNIGTFTYGTSTVKLSGAGKFVSGNTDFNNLTVVGSCTVPGNAIHIFGNLIILGSWDFGSGSSVLDGDLLNAGSLISSGIATFSGTRVQTMQLLGAIQSTSSGVINFNGSVAPVLFSTTAPQFVTLNINNTAGITPSVGWTVFGLFTVGSGAAFNAGNLTHTFYGPVLNYGTLTSSGTLDFRPSTNRTILFSGPFSSTGTVRFGGTGLTTILGSGAAFNDVVIANTHAAGITPNTSWTLARELVIASGATFHAGAGLTHTIAGNVTVDGTLNGQSSSVVFNGTTEITGNGQKDFNHLLITGAVVASGDFSVTGNFTNNGAFDATAFDVTFQGSSAAVIVGTTTPTAFDSLVIAKTSATVTLGVSVASLSTLTISSGTLTLGTSNLLPNDAALIMNGGTFSGQGYSNAVGALTIQANSTVTLGTNTTGSLTFTNGTYTAGILSINNWTGTAGVSGTANRIFVTAAPSTTFLTNINFTGYQSAAIRLGTGEIVPATHANGNWNVDAAGNWSTAANWSSNPNVPGNAAGDTVGLTFNITAARTVTIDTTSRMVGTLNMGDAGSSYFGYTLTNSGGAGLTFDNSGSTANLVQAATTATDVIALPITLLDNLSVSNSSALAVSGVISGGNNITKLGAGTVTLSGSNTYTGTTTVSNGTLAINGSLNTNLVTVAVGARLIGGGTINGPVTIQSGATLQPGTNADHTSSLTVSNTLNLAGATLLALNRTNAQNSSRVSGLTTVTYGGMLTVTNFGPALVAADTFTLFSAASQSGAFSATNLPVLSTGQNWWTTNNFATLTVNELTASNATRTRARDLSTKIKIADLLTNVVSLPAGNTFTLASVSASTNGTAITTNSNYIFFTPTNNLNESVTYTVSDARGGSATATIIINVVSTAGAAQTISVSGGTATVNCAGIPGYTYAIQRSTNLVAWVTLHTTNAPSLGLFNFTDSFEDLGGPPSSAYYRTIQP